ncbi:ATP-dependent helicase [Mucilaginibacter mali]|uniref:ATP-dependent helicase n=1 Tax=Mucilaginibacter mali TaxID=2740462 RepID=A0A7D4U0E5_9SPHI|nr:UvrD-helicase domain-containing protein [Mucilaginibacter mali]QKJ32877.1 ATP-dependent helicase [Mucilaginibacter mali]
MDKEKIEPEVLQILGHIEKGENFLLSGGAGSGKTYSLVQVIKSVIEADPHSKVACMTYTNAAVREIESRVDHPNLLVSTIHDFLWGVIGKYQKELKKELINLLNSDHAGFKLPEAPVPNDYFDALEDGITYKEWTRLTLGEISHDEVLELANVMFKNYPLLCSILKDKFKYIFIDEYQDTSPLIVETLLIHLQQSLKKNVIGFFGDAMQSIYDEDGIGNLDEYLAAELVVEVQKKQNRRNPLAIITLANDLRTDGLEQEPSKDMKAPNMKDGVVKQGSIRFYHAASYDEDKIRAILGWDFENAEQTKALFLTHNLIAPKAGFVELMLIYDKDPIIGLKKDILNKIKDNNKRGVTNPVITEGMTFDQVVDLFQLKNIRRQLKKDIILSSVPDLYNQLKDLHWEVMRKIYIEKEELIDDKKQDAREEKKKGSKRDRLIRHLFKIEDTLHYYRKKNYREFLKRTEFRIRTNKDKVQLKNFIETLETMADASIEDVINYAAKTGVCVKDDHLDLFIENNSYLYGRVKQVKYGQFKALYQYLEGHTPFSTQHKTKGAEFENVLVVMDNGNWNDYNFEYLFTDRTDKESVLDRTQKIFYVCCTRAKENLVIFYIMPQDNIAVKEKIIKKAQQWFGVDNVIPLL